jgi:phosphatidate cytidylyltransferase
VLKRRIVSAAVLIPLVGLLVYLGSWPFAAVIALVALLAGYEYLALLASDESHPNVPVALLFVLAAVADGYWPQLRIMQWALWPMMALLLAEQVFRRNRPGSVFSWAAAVAGVLYVGLSLSYFVRLRALDRGDLRVAIALIGTWVCDSGAYFVGSAWGKRRLAPQISPNKTWAGVWGGLATGVLVVWLMSWLLLGLPHWQGILLGAVIVAAATLGDLAESVIKRQVGVKDSGSLIPGHGGMLDRVDSLLFVAPAVYYCMMLFYYL